jgi:hypothetical protein
MLIDCLQGQDPTHGCVDYVNRDRATELGLTIELATAVYIGVDHNNVYGACTPGRPSVRIESKVAYNHGLIIADIWHMPGGICGTWPALWVLEPPGLLR